MFAKIGGLHFAKKKKFRKKFFFESLSIKQAGGEKFAFKIKRDLLQNVAPRQGAQMSLRKGRPKCSPTKFFLMIYHWCRGKK
jgi:hypothetical protein